MSSLSGYDSEVVGFDSRTEIKRSDKSSSTQTTNFFESGTGTQTTTSSQCGTNTDPDLNAGEEILKEYPPPGLNEFLRKVVPAMMEQLDLNKQEEELDASDSDEEEIPTAKLFQEIDLKNVNADAKSAGDHAPAAILDLSWSSARNSLAASIGTMHHEEWCQHEGLIKVFTTKRSEGDKLVDILDIKDESCVSVLKYHPSVAALLAYGTCSGNIAVCNLRNINYEGNRPDVISSVSHDGKRVSVLHWADPSLASSFLALKLTGKRRGASDQVLVTAGSDGKVNVWQVNMNLSVLENIVCYQINGVQKSPPPDITCIDFIKTYSLKATETDNDVFVVGSKAGELFVCKSKPHKDLSDNASVDPVYDNLEGHPTCVLNISFILERAGVFASISIDSELRVYDVEQRCPLKVIRLEDPISCMVWLPNPQLVVLGLAKITKHGQMLKVYNIANERTVPVDGLSRTDDLENVSLTALSLQQSSVCRIAAADNVGCIGIWDIPVRRIPTNNSFIST